MGLVICQVSGRSAPACASLCHAKRGCIFATGYRHRDRFGGGGKGKLYLNLVLRSVPTDIPKILQNTSLFPLSAHESAPAVGALLGELSSAFSLIQEVQDSKQIPRWQGVVGPSVGLGADIRG